MSDTSNYLVNVVCPHCKATILCSVSGFGGELAVRQKQCKKCGKEFFLHLLASTSANKDVPDGYISSIRGRIRHLLKTRLETLAEMLLRHEQASRLYNEALEEARRMRERHTAN